MHTGIEPVISTLRGWWLANSPNAPLLGRADCDTPISSATNRHVSDQPDSGRVPYASVTTPSALPYSYFPYPQRDSNPYPRSESPVRYPLLPWGRTLPEESVKLIPSLHRKNRSRRMSSSNPSHYLSSCCPNRSWNCSGCYCHRSCWILLLRLPDPEEARCRRSCRGGCSDRWLIRRSFGSYGTGWASEWIASEPGLPDEA